MSDEAALLAGYMPLVVRAGSTTKEDRTFAASMIAQGKRGRPISNNQIWRMRRIVAKFQDAHMRDDE